MGILDILLPVRCLGCGKLDAYFCIACRAAVRIVGQNEMICPVCGRLAVDGRTHPGCRGRGVPDGAVRIYHYGSIIRKAVKALKYRSVSHIAREFVRMIPPTSHNFIRREVGVDNAILVPVPLHWWRQKRRGFNQAEVLGKFLAARLEIQMATGILKRTRYTTPQVEVRKRADRLKNMTGAGKPSGFTEWLIGLIDMEMYRLNTVIRPASAYNPEQVFAVNKVMAKQYAGRTVILFDDVFTTGATMRAATRVLKSAGFRTVWAVTMAG